MAGLYDQDRYAWTQEPDDEEIIAEYLTAVLEDSSPEVFLAAVRQMNG